MICVFFFSPVKFCSFNTLIYPSKNIYWQKLWIVNMFNMFLKVQCRYKHMVTTLLHLEHIVIALERMFGVVQRIQFRCFPFPKRTSLFLLPWLTRWRGLKTLLMSGGPFYVGLRIGNITICKYIPRPRLTERVGVSRGSRLGPMSLGDHAHIFSDFQFVNVY